MSSVMVFDIDGLSIRSAGCYGNVETATPLLNEFASQARLFEQHYRAFVDPVRDRDQAYGSLVASLGSTGLLLANAATRSSHDVTVYESPDQLLEILEQRFDTEGHVGWVRIVPAPEALDEAIPLGLITRLIEAGVVVVVTTTTPLLDEQDYRVENEEAIRVPLMVWSADPFRSQAVTSSAGLSLLLSEELLAGGSVVIQSEAAVALREPTSLLVATLGLLSSLEAVSDERLMDVVDVTDDRLQVFRKPEDVWNVHNVLVEDLARGIETLIRLRQQLLQIET
jgi:hypothetical protein